MNMDQLKTTIKEKIVKVELEIKNCLKHPCNPPSFVKNNLAYIALLEIRLRAFNEVLELIE